MLRMIISSSFQIIAGDFDSSNKSKAQIKAQFVNRKEASVRRERALAYAYTHQVYIKLIQLRCES